jgi:hypothetical protein
LDPWGDSAGLLTDRYGGRIIFTVLFIVSAAAAVVLANANTYNELLISGFLVRWRGRRFRWEWVSSPSGLPAKARNCTGLMDG